MPVGIYKRTEEHNRKNSEARKGKKQSAISNLKRSETLKGRVFTEEHRLKISKALNGKSKSDEHKKNIGLSSTGRWSGDKNPRWRGGISSENYLLRHSRESRKWRIAVFEKDDYTCQICGDSSGNGYKVELNAHHIKPWAEYKELRYDIDNGMTLCCECHRKIHGLNKKYNN